MLLLEGFDYLGTVVEKYVVSDSGRVTTNGSSRSGALCMKVSKNDWCDVPLAAASDTGVIGFALYCYDPTDSPKPLLSFERSGNVNMTLNLRRSGALELRRGSTVLGASTTQVFLRNAFQYIEVKWNCVNSISADSVQVKIDGTLVIDLAATTDCQDSGTSGVDLIILHSPGTTIYYDDLYICDLAGAQCNDFLGNIIIETLFPDGNGNTSDFVGSDVDSTDNYLHVDDATSDGDTTYVESSTPGDIDLYTLDDIGGTPDTILCVASDCFSRKDDGSARDGRLLTRVNGSNYEGASFSPTTSFVHEAQIWELNPDDSAAWEVADVNGAEIGIKVQS